jgi:hypothetical protein
MNKVLLAIGRKAFANYLSFICLSAFLHFLLLSSPVLTQAQQWQAIASGQDIATSSSSFTHIATTLDGAVTVPYVVYTESGIPKVKKFDGDSWLPIGGNISETSATYTRIFSDGNGRLLVTYVDVANGSRLAIKTYNETSNLWEPLNGNADNLYLSSGSVNNSISQYSSTRRSELAFDADGHPYVIYGEGAALNPYVKKFNGQSWEIVGNAAVSTDRAIGVSIILDELNTPYIVYVRQPTATSTTGPMAVYRFTGNWENIAVPSPVPGGSSTTGATTSIRHTSMSLTATGNPVVSYFNTGNSNRTTVIIYNKATNTWAYQAAISGRDAPSSSLTRDNAGNLYASFADAMSNGSGRSLARVMKLATGSAQWTELKNADVAQGIDEPAGNLSIAAGADGRPYIIYTKVNSQNIVTPIVQVFTQGVPPPPPPPPPADEVVTTPKQVEKLNRGLVAVRLDAGKVFVSWRFFGTDASSTAFNLYRDGVKVNETPISSSTNYIDNTTEDGLYSVKAVTAGVEGPASVPAIVWQQNYLDIQLDKPAGGTTPDGVAYTYSPNDCSVGDLDGDGNYEIIVKWDPSNAKDNSQSGYTGNVYLDAYKLNGTRLWRIDLGRNIRAGAHYTQFMVYDLDGDGKAEIACKTADGTIDGKGITIGDPVVDYRNSGGYILSGPEFLSIFNGETGAAIATTNYLPARGSVSSWGDNYGNRVDRFIAVIAYLDGARPSLVMGRGYYTRLVRAAWDWREGKLTQRWIFDSNAPGNSLYAGQGNHQMTVGDVDGDGKDEIFNGSSGINDNGNRLWANGMGHGDALHMSDLDPERPGLEIWQPYEYPPGNGRVGAALVDAKTGERIFTVSEATADVGRGLTADVDPRYKGNELWAARGGLYTSKGVQIGTAKPSMNFAIWWDGDLSRELLDGISINKWDYTANRQVNLLTATGHASNNSTKATPNLSADLLGDWREEVIFRASDNNSLRLFTTNIATTHRIYTLMHDPQYRVAIAWQNSGYNQPPHPGFYLGNEMNDAPVPNVAYVQDVIPPVAIAKNITVTLQNGEATITASAVDNGSYDAFDIRSYALDKTTFNCNDIGANNVQLTVTDNNGKTASASAVVTVLGELPSAPQIQVSRTDNSFTGGDANTVFMGYGAQQLLLTASNPGTTGIGYTWLPSAYLQHADSATTIFTPVAAGDYQLTVTATNTFGCTATASQVLKVIDVRCGNNMDKVMVCHKGKMICIDVASVADHLAHGCSIGSCGQTGRNVSQERGDFSEIPVSGFNIYPNPVVSRTRIEFRFAFATKYTLEIYDIRGAKIRQLSAGDARAGNTVAYDLNAGDYSKGVYFIRLKSDREVVTRRVVIQ